jgi:hypothetical protein
MNNCSQDWWGVATSCGCGFKALVTGRNWGIALFFTNHIKVRMKGKTIFFRGHRSEDERLEEVLMTKHIIGSYTMIESWGHKAGSHVQENMMGLQTNQTMTISNVGVLKRHTFFHVVQVPHSISPAQRLETGSTAMNFSKDSFCHILLTQKCSESKVDQPSQLFF